MSSDDQPPRLPANNHRVVRRTTKMFQNINSSSNLKYLNIESQITITLNIESQITITLSYSYCSGLRYYNYCFSCSCHSVGFYYPHLNDYWDSYYILIGCESVFHLSIQSNQFVIGSSLHLKAFNNILLLM